MTGMDFCRSDAFGHRGELFACEWGTLAPRNSPHETDLDHGFRVVRVNVKTGSGETFFRNRAYGAAYDLKSGGIERPVGCKFGPDGRSLYVLDLGTVRVSKGLMIAYARTGALWKITRRLSKMPTLVEMDPASWKVQLDRVEQWLGNLLTAQIAFRQHAEDVVGKTHEPHIAEAVAQVAESAREHERQIDELYRVIGRDPSATCRAPWAGRWAPGGTCTG